MPSPKKKAPVKPKQLSPKELQKKCEDLTELTERLQIENEEMKIKFKMICQQICKNTDLTEYNYIDKDLYTQPDRLNIEDLIHMIQKLALKATKIKSRDELKKEMDSIEYKMNELINVDSGMFKEKFKLQDRLEFIKLERDFWKRNAESFKKMHDKLVKDHEPPLLSINNCVVNDRPKSSKVVKVEDNSFSSSSSEITSFPSSGSLLKRSKTNINRYSKSCKSQKNKNTDTLSEIQNKPDKIPDSENKNYFQKSTDNFKESENKNIITSDCENSFQGAMIRNMGNMRKKFEGIPNQLKNNSVDSIDIIEKPNSKRHGLIKNVSFNKEVDVGVYRKDSKNLKLIESYFQPTTASVSGKTETVPNRSLETAFKENNSNYQAAPIDVHNQIRNLLSARNNYNNGNIENTNTLFSIVNRRTSSPISNTSSDNKFTSRASTSICSMRKFPGETPVKDLEPTLKMIIIKELSVQKVDGNDWRQFARRIGISEFDITEWSSLKLQYPMARVLSFWSSRSDSTTRLLHRHLNAPCFNYSILAKRIENFYDVL